MKTVRIIPRLDIKGPNLVKGIHLEGLRVLGKPEDFAEYYYKNGADELLYVDIVASLYDRNSLHEIITKTAKKIFIPLTVGGGIRDINDIKQILRAGADKVSLNTAAIKNPPLIQKASRLFGSSTIAVTIEAIKQSNNRYLAYTDNGREFTNIDVLPWAKKVEELGAGEIILTSIDKEGTGLGFDLDLIKLVSNSVSIPVVAHGGPGTLQHLRDAIEMGASAISVASMLHYDFLKKNSSPVDADEGNSTFLTSGKPPTYIKPASIKQIKKYLSAKNITCRYPC